MEFRDVVARRRMVRAFAPDPIPSDVLQRIAAVAQRAPSAGFSQGQRLVVVTDRAARRRLAELYGEPEMVDEGFDRWISEAPAIVVPCVSEAVYRARYREPDKAPDGVEIEWPIPYWWMDAGCTVMLVLLAAVDEGLAAGFAGSPEPAAIAALKAELGIPADFAPLGLIPIGRPRPDKRSPSLARGWVPTPEFARFEHW